MKDPIQEQLITARQNQILDAAGKVFAEKGFHPTTIKDIAKTAGIADGTIYLYFANKTALLFGILERMKIAAMQDVDFTAFSSGDVRSSLKAYLHHPLKVFKADNFELFRVIMSEIMVNADLRAQFYAQVIEPTAQVATYQLEQWAAQGLIKPLKIDVISRVISSVIMGVLVQHIMGDKTLEAEWDTLPTLLADMILDGIGIDNVEEQDT